MRNLPRQRFPVGSFPAKMLMIAAALGIFSCSTGKVYRKIAMDGSLPTDPADAEQWLTSPAFHSYFFSEKILSEVSHTGVHTFSADTNLFGDDTGFSESTGREDGTWDFSGLKEKLDLFNKVDGKSVFILRVYAGAPVWWKSKNQDQLDQYADGCAYVGTHRASSGRCMNPNGTEPSEPVQARHASIASDALFAQWKTGIRKLRESLDDWGYTSRVVALTITGQSSQEWISWDANFTQIPGVRPMAYGPVHRRAYKKWLMSAFGGSRASLDVPSETEFSVANHPDSRSTAFLDPSRDGNVSSYYLFRSSLTATIIAKIARELKSAFGGIRVGAIYGYMNEMGGDPSFGHNALGQLLESPDIDFINPMPSYLNRTVGGADFERQPITSVSINGKYVLNDLDHGTHVSKDNYDWTCSQYAVSTDPGVREVYRTQCKSGDPSSLYNYNLALTGFRINPSGAVVPPTIEEDVSNFRRWLGYTIARDIRFSYMSLSNRYLPPGQEKSYLSDDYLLSTVVPQINQAKARSYRYDRSSIAEVLVVSDEASPAYARSAELQPDLSDPTRNRAGLNYHALASPRLGLNKMGAPYDHIMLSDLKRTDTSRYKLVIFLNAWSVGSADRDLIAQKLKRDGKIIVWNYAAGLFKEGRKSEANIEELTGIHMISTGQTLAPTVKIKPNLFPLFRSAYVSTPQYSSPCCDLLSVADAKASPLATYANSSTPPAMAIRVFPGWKSVWSATVDLPPGAFRDLARYAGVHVYNDFDEPFYANKSYVTLVVHADSAETRTLHFPRPVDLYEAISDAPIASGVREIAFPVVNGGVYIFRVR